MSRGKIIALIVTVGILVLGGYLASISTWKDQTIPTPLGGDAAINPFYAAMRLTTELDGKPVWRRTLGTLTPEDDVLVLTAWHWSISEPRRTAIQDWVQAGGRLVVDSSLLGVDELLDWAGIEYQYPDYSGEDEEDDEETSRAPADCRDFEQRGAAGALDANAASLYLCGMEPYGRFWPSDNITWALADTTGIQVIRVAAGKGSVTIVDGTPFTWRSLQSHNHPHLLVRALNLARGDRVVFLSADREQSLLELIWQYGAPAVLLGLFALVLALWRGVVPFGPPLADPPTARRSLDEQIRGTGQFLLRTNGAPVLYTAVRAALDQVAERQVRGWASLSEPERVAALSALTGIEQARLLAARDWPRQARRADLAPSIACLESTRRLVAANRAGRGQHFAKDS